MRNRGQQQIKNKIRGDFEKKRTTIATCGRKLVSTEILNEYNNVCYLWSY